MATKPPITKATMSSGIKSVFHETELVVTGVAVLAAPVFWSLKTAVVIGVAIPTKPDNQFKNPPLAVDAAGAGVAAGVAGAAVEVVGVGATVESKIQLNKFIISF